MPVRFAATSTCSLIGFSRYIFFCGSNHPKTKRFADVASLPPDFEIAPEWDVCFASIMRPAAQTRIRKLMEQGFHRPGGDCRALRLSDRRGASVNAVASVSSNGYSANLTIGRCGGAIAARTPEH